MAGGSFLGGHIYKFTREQVTDTFGSSSNAILYFQVLFNKDRTWIYLSLQFFFQFGILLSTLYFLVSSFSSVKNMDDCHDCEFRAVSLDNLKEHIAENHVFDKLFSFIMNDSSTQTSTASSEKQNFKEIQKYSPAYPLEQTNDINLGGKIQNDKYVESNLDYQIIKDEEMEDENYETRKDTMKNGDPTQTIKLGKKVTRKTKEGKFGCSQEGCNYSSNFKRVLKEHCESTHLKLMRYSCNLCPYKSYFKKDIRDHQSYKLCNEEAKKILRIGCSLCEQNVRHKNHFINPREPKGENKCKESGCGFSAVSKSKLRIHHESFHLQITKYACNLCE